MKIYVDSKLCEECKGACCKVAGCIFDQDQFRENGNIIKLDHLIEKLEEGRISISGQPVTGFFGDSWTFILYLKARDENADIVDILGNGGPCSQLTSNGCKFSIEKRPIYGKTVKPTKIGGPCEQTADNPSDRYSFIYNWLLYYDVLSSAVEYYTGVETEKYCLERLKEDAKKINEKIKNNKKLNTMECVKNQWYSDIVNDKPYVSPKFTQDWMNSCMGF